MRKPDKGGQLNGFAAALDRLQDRLQLIDELLERQQKAAKAASRSFRMLQEELDKLERML